MGVFHYLQMRAFCHETEDEARVRQALRHAATTDKAKFTDEVAEGSHGNRILLLEAQVNSAPAAKAFFTALATDDPEGFSRFRSELDRRLDEHLNVYLRVDKQEAYAGRLRLSQGDDAITVRGKIRSFASKRSGLAPEEGRASLEEFLQGIVPTSHDTIEQ